MNDIKTKQQIWATLPIPIRELLNAENTPSKIEAIAQKQGLGFVEQGFLVRITANLLRGELSPREFIPTISGELDVSREVASLIAQDINHDIFGEVKDALKEVHAVGSGAKKDGGVARLDPSLVTCLPGEMSPEAALGNKAPGNAVMSGSIMEQKLGGVFRMKGQEIATMGGVQGPTLVTPPPPQSLRPAVPPPPAQKADPYREQAI
jgi:hypothetical protein